MTELRKILGVNMKAYRAELGYSQARLAELVDTATNYIAQIENGKRFPTDNMLEKIAFALQKKGYELFSINNQMTGSITNLEKKLEKKWKKQLLTDLEKYVNNWKRKV